MILQFLLICLFCHRKLKIKFGPCQPLQNDLPNKIFPFEINKEKIKRSFNDKHYYRILPDKSKCHRDWLSYSLSKNKIVCIHCMLFGTNLRSNLEKSWTKEGFNKWKNCSFAIQRHELTPDHVTSSLKFKLRQKNLPILPSIENNRKTQIAMNRNVLLELIDIVIYMGRHNLAFRGHCEDWSSNSRGNFKDLVILMSKNSGH